ncbi:bifunctional phosphoribosylaminoimidazolecarboxamide formyltransferase/inosine monophosphate cyclohydrolase [Candidatus Marinamargulisbacteria bacterium SCGC AG-414-C22]|nr:bifunctional phosphoribosylaminoimidazolecarboxamide formyltransferase/inosine monophosphate cyclohydrolase [Candidatus Marinamargulisbacteria bacterium SCGC AG-414-C22]
MKALISVSNKENIVPFAKGLSDLGYDLISTGGTLKVLSDNGLRVTSVSDLTEFPEILDGRVKTLHPKIYGGILARRDDKKHVDTCKEENINFLDLVVVNLYPFEKTIANPSATLTDAIENIDIGGPTLLRASAKNYKDVGVVVNPSDYESILKELQESNNNLSIETRSRLATTAFCHTAQYDMAISNYFQKQFLNQTEEMPELVSPMLEKIADLRYGENPHQLAGYYKIKTQNEDRVPFKQLHGKELSYNNILDVSSAIAIVESLDLPAAAVIKHTNPCGAAVGDSIDQAYEKAHAADPLSAYGSIVGLNRVVDLKTAELLAKTFIEVIIAPGFDQDAFECLTKKNALRLIETDSNTKNQEKYMYRFINNGFLLQTPDQLKLTEEQLTYITETKPSKVEKNDLFFAFNLVKFIKSNAILIVKDGKTIGIGAGQMSRVDAVEIALKKAGDNAKGAVLASDAFFPFSDSIELAAQYGIKAIIQPGGSKRDNESIEACNKYDISMVFTGTRHFLH